MSPVSNDDTRDQDRALADRLRRFVVRERHASLRDLRELWRLPVAARIESGDAIAPLRFLGTDERGKLRFALEQDLSRFRAGDSLRVGDGDDPESGAEVTYIEHDASRGELIGDVPWGADRAALLTALRQSASLVADRGEFDASATLSRMIAAVFDDHASARAAAVRALLAGRVSVTIDESAREEARLSAAKLARRGITLDDAQAEAWERAWAASPVHLVQGPPGTGKTWLLAHLAAALAWRGERLLVTALTHQAVDNALRAIARVAATTGSRLAIARFNAREGAASRELARVGVSFARGRGAEWPRTGGLVIGTTALSAPSLAESAPALTRVVFDEAAQITVPHALAALALAPRVTLFGDDQQLGPVLALDHDGEGDSLFAWLRASAPPTMLTATHRMNEALCAFPSAAFYGGRLRPARAAADRRFTLGGASEGVLASILDAPLGPVLVEIAHEGHRIACPPERDAAVAIAHAMLTRGLSPHDLAIVAPFRLQNLEIARALSERLGPGAAMPVVDTVERIQGQEREAVIVSLTCSDPDALRRDTRFFFSPNRLNVSLTRARTRLIVLASPALLATIPHDLAGLARLDVFHRMFAHFPRVAWPASG